MILTSDQVISNVELFCFAFFKVQKYYLLDKYSPLPQLCRFELTCVTLSVSTNANCLKSASSALFILVLTLNYSPTQLVRTKLELIFRPQ